MLPTSTRFAPPIRRVLCQLTGPLLAAALGLSTAPVAAQQPNAPPPTTPEQDEARDKARVLALEGLTLMEKQKFDEARDRFERAEALFHAPTNLRLLGQALVALGRLARAKEVYERAANEELPFYAPQPFKDAQAAAKNELAALVPRVPTVELVVPPGAKDVEVLIDKAKVPSEQLGKPIFVDPGEHRIVASAENARDVHRKFTVKEGERARLELALTPQSQGGPDKTPDKLIVKPGGSYIPAAIAFGIGAVGIGVGAVAGAVAIGKANDVKSRCQQDGAGGLSCPPDAEPEADSARSMGTVSTIGFVVGGVGVAAGVVLLVVRPKGTRAQVGLQVAPQRLSVVGRF